MCVLTPAIKFRSPPDPCSLSNGPGVKAQRPSGKILDSLTRQALPRRPTLHSWQCLFLVKSIPPWLLCQSSNGPAGPMRRRFQILRGSRLRSPDTKLCPNCFHKQQDPSEPHGWGWRGTARSVVWPPGGKTKGGDRELSLGTSSHRQNKARFGAPIGRQSKTSGELGARGVGSALALPGSDVPKEERVGVLEDFTFPGG